VNMGTRDIGSAHSQILLLRGLDTLTTEDEIVKALRSIPGRTGSDVRADGVHKVMITKDKASRGSWGFGFVQFADVRVRCSHY
jgi:RNA-binding protein 5/10